MPPVCPDCYRSKRTIQKVFLLSGGRTSAYMLDRTLKENPQARDEYIFAFGNTGKERPETLNFLRQLEVYYGIDLVWLEYRRVPASKIPSGIFPTKRRNQNLARKVELGESNRIFRCTRGCRGLTASCLPARRRAARYHARGCNGGIGELK